MTYAAASLALLAWLYLLVGRGRFWQAGPVLPVAPPMSDASVAIIVPARDEAAVIAASLASLLAQAHRRLRVILVDDQSSDGTGEIARAIADTRLTVLSGAAKPAGWSGKLWALAQGVEAAGDVDYLFFTDADILHDPGHLACLLAHAQRNDLDMVSEMVALNCVSWAERALVPAFVLFFQLLYPFDWVNDRRRAVAAAAGGTVLLRRTALLRIGGIAAISGALIDDVSLAKAVKAGGPIWLGHSMLARSVRPYPGAGDIWRMVARTAFVQLRRSWLLLAATVFAMAVIWLAPPALALFAHGVPRLVGVCLWLLAAAVYVPTLVRFRLSLLWAPCLPAIAVFYLAATVGSALDDLRGRGVVWKQRAYTKGG
jgi:hopene-associated glycosyltransferase HpnB